MNVKGDLLERLLIIQSILEQDSRIKNIERKVNMIIKELAIYDEAFEEEGKESILMNLEPESEISNKNTAYLQKILNILENLNRENR